MCGWVLIEDLTPKRNMAWRGVAGSYCPQGAGPVLATSLSIKDDTYVTRLAWKGETYPVSPHLNAGNKNMTSQSLVRFVRISGRAEAADSAGFSGEP